MRKEIEAIGRMDSQFVDSELVFVFLPFYTLLLFCQHHTFAKSLSIVYTAHLILYVQAFGTRRVKRELVEDVN